MSHIQKLSKLYSECKSTGECTEYQVQLAREFSIVDSSTTNANQMATSWGVLFGLIGLAILLTPYNKLLRNIRGFILPKLIVLSPVILGIVAGLVIGFIISFGACFKQECSTLESSSVITIPLISLIFSVPFAIKISSQSNKLSQKLSSKSIFWVVIGLMIILISYAETTANINNNNEVNANKKFNLERIGGADPAQFK